MDYLPFILEMLILGLAVGIISNGLGLGGGIVMVPAFIEFVPGMDSYTAKGTSLFIIIFVAGYNAYRLNKGHPIPWKLAGCIAGGSVIGAYASSWFIQPRFVNEEVVLLCVAAFALFTGLRTLVIKDRSVSEEDARERYALAVAIGLVTGLVSGATGIGGGGVMIPLALIAGVVSNGRVVALSNLVMVATCVAATMAHLAADKTFGYPMTVGQVNLLLAPLIFVGAFASAKAGRWLNKQLTLQRRKIVMGLLLLFIAVRLIWRAYG